MTANPAPPDRVIRAAFKGPLGAFALDAAFTAPAHGVTALFGPSGCGKTTVLRCLAGLHRTPEGACEVAGEVWQAPAVFRPPHRRPVGFVFQDASLFPHLSVRRNLFYGAPRAAPDAGGRVRFDEIVEFLGLGRLLDRMPKALSGGERQRVGIGRALLSDPALVLMDEPLSALDRAAKDEVLALLERLRDRLTLPIVYVTHDLGEVERLADHLVLMEAGRVLASGPLGRLQSDPSLPLARGRDAAVTLDGVIVNCDPAYGLVTLGVGAVRFLVPAPAGPAGAARRLRIAASDVSLSLQVGEASTILNRLPVTIRSAAPAGPHELVAVLGLDPAPDGPVLLARVTRLSWERLGLAEGMPAFAQVKSVALAREGVG